MTRLGFLVHAFARKLAIALAVTATLAVLASYFAWHERTLREMDDNVRRALIGFQDRHSIDIKSRGDALDVDVVVRAAESVTHRRSHSLHLTMTYLRTMYDLDRPTQQLDNAHFKKALASVSDRIKQDLASVLEPACKSPEDILDRQIFCAFAGGVENYLSTNGTVPDHVDGAATILAGVSDLPSSDRAVVPVLTRMGIKGFFALPNAIGVEKTNSVFMRALANGAQDTTLARDLDVAYSCYSECMEGPPFARFRATNNLIDLELRILSDSLLVESVSIRKTPLGLNIGRAVSTPAGWYAARLKDLNKLETQTAVPEISLTKLQLVSTYAKYKYRSLGSQFCESQGWADCVSDASAALERAIGSGFARCEFFEHPSENGLAVLVLCPSANGTSSLCDKIREAYRRQGQPECVPCRDQGTTK
jgi:hypothetical protein